MSLKILIRNSEERYVWYKNQIEHVHKNKSIYDKDKELFEWYKSLLRDMKNSEEKWLKSLIEEKRYENEGLNPPFCYYSKNI